MKPFFFMCTCFAAPTFFQPCLLFIETKKTFANANSSLEGNLFHKSALQANGIFYGKFTPPRSFFSLVSHLSSTSFKDWDAGRAKAVLEIAKQCILIGFQGDENSFPQGLKLALHHQVKLSSGVVWGQVEHGEKIKQIVAPWSVLAYPHEYLFDPIKWAPLIMMLFIHPRRNIMNTNFISFRPFFNRLQHLKWIFSFIPNSTLWRSTLRIAKTKKKAREEKLMKINFLLSVFLPFNRHAAIVMRSCENENLPNVNM